MTSMTVKGAKTKLYQQLYNALCERGVYREDSSQTGPLGKDVSNLCTTYLLQLANHCNDNAHLTAEQDMYVANIILTRAQQVLTQMEEDFTGMEMIQLATYVNSCHA